jgi:chromosome segregation ATPase
MAVHDHTLVLVCDDQLAPHYTMRLDNTDLRDRAARSGLHPNTLLARYIREELGRSYAIVATDQELETIATLLLEHGANHMRPLQVRKLTVSPTARGEVERQLADCQNRLQKALSALQGERLLHKRERETGQRDLEDTRATLGKVQADREQHLRKIGELTIQLEGAHGTEEQLRNMQRDLALLTSEREALSERVERITEEFGAVRDERDQLRQSAANMAQELELLRQQRQQLQEWAKYLERICAMAFQQLIQGKADSEHQLPTELHDALEKYKRQTTFEPHSF